MTPNPLGLPDRARRRERIALLDTIRGACVVVMVLYHLYYDLCACGPVVDRLSDDPIFRAARACVAGTFFLISGIASRFSRSNLRRGVRILCWACVVTVVSWAVGETILFGVLHCLGCGMVLYSLAGDRIDRVDRRILPLLCILGTALTAPMPLQRFSGVKGLFWLGIPSPEFASADYYPLLPWLFVFLLGTWAGGAVRDRRLPDRFYTIDCPPLSAIGRVSLSVYLFHQPVCYSAALLAARLMGRR